MTNKPILKIILTIEKQPNGNIIYVVRLINNYIGFTSGKIKV